MCIVRWSSSSQRIGIIFFFRMIIGLIQFGKSIQNFVTGVNSLKVIHNKNRKTVNFEWIRTAIKPSELVTVWKSKKKLCMPRGVRKVSVHFKCLDCYFVITSRSRIWVQTASCSALKFSLKSRFEFIDFHTIEIAIKVKRFQNVRDIKERAASQLTTIPKQDFGDDFLKKRRA